MPKPTNLLSRLSLVAVFIVGHARANAQTLDSYAVTPDNFITSAAASADGKLLVGGSFVSISGEARPRFARITANGAVDATPAIGITTGSGINCIIVHPDGTLLVGGTFSQFAGEMHGNLAHIQANATIDSTFTTSTNGTVFAMALQSDGKILVGGSFTILGGETHERIGRLNADGTVDATFTASVNDDVTSILFSGDAPSHIFVAGDFTEVNGTPRGRIARLEPNGSLDPSFNLDANGLVTGMAQQSDGKILVFGNFSTIGGVGQNKYVRLNANGTRDTAFVLPTNTSISSMTVQSDGKILVMGTFANPPITGSAILRVENNGAFDAGFTPVPLNQSAHLVLDGTGKIFAAGPFTSIMGEARTFVARLTNPTAPVSTLEFDTDLTWTIGGSAPIPTIVRFQASVDGSAWTDLGAGTFANGAWTLTAPTLPVDSTQVRALGILPTNGSDSSLISASTEITATASRLLNISTRALCGTGDSVMIPGFVVSGTGSKQLLIRAVGPTLGRPPFNIAGVLPNPRMTLKRLDTSQTPNVFVDVASNDEWQTNPNAAEITSTATAVSAFPLDDAHEAALLVNVTPGQYTVVVDDADGGTGIAIVEAYDADTAASTTSLLNISNRGFVGEGDQVMIPGFVISAEGPKTVLIRAVGPTLAGVPFNVAGTMPDPKFDLYRRDGSTDVLLASQDNWSDHVDAALTASVATQVSAFPLAVGTKDAAFVMTLQPGAYTVVTSSAVAAETGVVIVEVYVAP